MELTHSFTVPTSVDDAWALFMDLERVGGCFPGATVTGVTDEGFTGTVKVKLGPIALQYAGSGSFVERDDAAHRAVIEAKGKDKRGNGTAGATVSIQLASDGDGTKADVVTDLAVTGKPAQFGRGVMQDVSDKLLLAFIECIEHQLEGAGAPEEAVEAGAGAAAEQPQPVEAEGAPTKAATGPAPGAPEGPAAAPMEPAAAAGPAVPAVPAAAPVPPRPAHARAGDEALDLGSTVLPVLARRYAPYAVVAVIGFLLGWLIGRRRG